MQPPKILDNKQQGRVIDELRPGLRPGAKLAVISAYVTRYAYEALQMSNSKSCVQIIFSRSNSSASRPISLL